MRFIWSFDWLLALSQNWEPPLVSGIFLWLLSSAQHLQIKFILIAGPFTFHPKLYLLAFKWLYFNRQNMEATVSYWIKKHWPVFYRFPQKSLNTMTNLFNVRMYIRLRLESMQRLRSKRKLINKSYMSNRILKLYFHLIVTMSNWINHTIQL